MSGQAVGRLRLATVWLGGCSGCHMSLLDLDEWLFELAARFDYVYGPFVDRKAFPDDVDVVLVEGAVTNTDNLEMAHRLRASSKLVVSFGDCAVTGNVTALRNPGGAPATMLQRVYVDAPDAGGVRPDAAEIVPELLEQAVPLHQVVPVDLYLPGCPPSAERIQAALEQVLDGGDRRFGIRFG